MVSTGASRWRYNGGSSLARPLADNPADQGTNGLDDAGSYSDTFVKVPPIRGSARTTSASGDDAALRQATARCAGGVADLRGRDSRQDPQSASISTLFRNESKVKGLGSRADGITTACSPSTLDTRPSTSCTPFACVVRGKFEPLCRFVPRADGGCDEQMMIFRRRRRRCRPIGRGTWRRFPGAACGTIVISIRHGARAGRQGVAGGRAAANALARCNWRQFVGQCRFGPAGRAFRNLAVAEDAQSIEVIVEHAASGPGGLVGERSRLEIEPG